MRKKIAKAIKTMNDRHICSRCLNGEKGCMSCCVSAFRDGSDGFCLTLSDIKRIVEATGLSPDEFCRLNKVNMADMKRNPKAYYPALFIGDSWIGMKGKNKCMFLGKNGCLIYGARPMICRIFPFWFDEKAKGIRPIIEFALVEDDRLCVNGCETNEKTMAALGETKKELVKKIRQFLTEVKHHNRHKQKLLKKGVKNLRSLKGLRQVLDEC